jgi:hypothetical protein
MQAAQGVFSGAAHREQSENRCFIRAAVSSSYISLFVLKIAPMRKTICVSRAFLFSHLDFIQIALPPENERNKRNFSGYVAGFSF